MRLLVDNEIIVALHNPAGNALAYTLEGDPPQPTQTANANVKPTSLDLTIGKIFIPGTPPNESAAVTTAKKSRVLNSRPHGRNSDARSNSHGSKALGDCISLFWPRRLAS